VDADQVPVCGLNYPYDPEDGRENWEAEGARVLRGGSWNLAQDYARCAARYGLGPGGWDGSVGFRVVVAPALF